LRDPAEFNIRKTVNLNAPVSLVWNALTDPEWVKQYLLGAKVVSDWVVGSKIVYSGSFNGIDFRDEGETTILETDKQFQYTYWGANHGTEKVKANHVILTYLLSKTDSGTQLTVTQENYRSKEIAEGMNPIGDLIFANLKNLVEGQA